jgi:hypothetical protein
MCLTLSLPSFASAFNESIGLMMAYVEKAVYCGRENFNSWNVGNSVNNGPKVNRSQIRFIQKNSTESAAGVGRMIGPDGCFVAMRGFLHCYESIQEEIFATLAEFGCHNLPLYMVGHSQGAAGISYALYDALDKGFDVKHAYALESPRVGNAVFSEALQAKSRGMDVWRVAHYKDIVVHVPPESLGFKHALPEIYYTDRNGTKHQQCQVENRHCSGQWPIWEWTSGDHMWYADINPCSCTYSADANLSHDSMVVV